MSDTPQAATPQPKLKIVDLEAMVMAFLAEEEKYARDQTNTARWWTITGYRSAFVDCINHIRLTQRRATKNYGDAAPMFDKVFHD